MVFFFLCLSHFTYIAGYLDFEKATSWSEEASLRKQHCSVTEAVRGLMKVFIHFSEGCHIYWG